MTVGDITSRALSDSRVSHEEFEQVLDQMRRFNERKRVIQDEFDAPMRKKQATDIASLLKEMEKTNKNLEREKEEVVAAAAENARREGEAQAFKKIAGLVYKRRIKLMATLVIGGTDDGYGSGKPGPPGPRGPRGAQEDKGDTGASGAQEDTGPKGRKGEKGDTGATGAQGDTGLRGPKGEKGDEDPRGDDGTDGTNGSDGAPGATGAQEPKGDTGATRPQGPKGDTGATGCSSM
ncbi:collagen alpha-1(XXV) chain-like [Xenia sp. Carnegie-2017]|uniref:collagen alpha-1(XXV) chain-like n=1 Tax=Xenia sp. Carnegie-2017 TaxID=2897299 RepID=UPI001F04B344|nr:collagen alpha-1(XXV) chain-like [Xenia sp. Carnegie-2017]